MKVTLWGTRGSVGAAGASTVLYGGDTSAVEVRADDGSLLVLDAGSGVRRLGVQALDVPRVDILLTHLHMDHIQGLGFFAPLYADSIEVHIYGPSSQESSLFEALTRYLSPPLFPVRLRELPLVHVHELARSSLTIGPFSVRSDYIIHPGHTLGYRVECDGASLAYMPDHEPALGHRSFPPHTSWLSGYDIARDVDLLIHDAQYTEEEYPGHVGWGHSALDQALSFAELCKVGHLCTFHHDPSHTDDMRTALEDAARERGGFPFALTSGIEGATFQLPNPLA